MFYDESVEIDRLTATYGRMPLLVVIAWIHFPLHEKIALKATWNSKHWNLLFDTATLDRDKKEREGESFNTC